MTFIAGTMKSAILQLGNGPSSFQSSRNLLKIDDYGCDELDDSDLRQAALLSFPVLNKSAMESEVPTHLANAGKVRQSSKEATASISDPDVWRPTQLRNGNWACNHICKDKRNCKHPCCRNGLERPPNPPKLPKPLEEQPTNKLSTDMTTYSNHSKIDARGATTTRPSANSLKKRKPTPEWDEFSDGLDDSVFDGQLHQGAAKSFNSNVPHTDPSMADRSHITQAGDRRKGGHSLFFHGTSSPDQRLLVPEVDLSSGQAEPPSPICKTNAPPPFASSIANPSPRGFGSSPTLHIPLRKKLRIDDGRKSIRSPSRAVVSTLNAAGLSKDRHVPSDFDLIDDDLDSDDLECTLADTDQHAAVARYVADDGDDDYDEAYDDTTPTLQTPEMVIDASLSGEAARSDAYTASGATDIPPARALDTPLVAPEELQTPVPRSKTEVETADARAADWIVREFGGYVDFV